VLAAFDRGQDAEPFTARDEQLLRIFAASAANAVAISRSVEADRLRSAIAASDAERAAGHESCTTRPCKHLPVSASGCRPRCEPTT